MNPPNPPAVFDLGTDELATSSSLDSVVDGVMEFTHVSE
jgi:hypothetical protein